MLPLRIAVENLGASVEWNDYDRSVSISDEGCIIKLKIDDFNVTVNGETVSLKTSPFIFDDRTMVSLQFFTDCMGYGVRVIDATQQVIITNDTPIMRVDDSYIHFDEVKLLFDADKDKYKGEEELLVKSCISNLYDTIIMCNNAAVKGIDLTPVEVAAALEKVDEDEGIYSDASLRSVYTYIVLNRALADKFSVYLSNESIPDEEEIVEYFNSNYSETELTDSLYEEIRYVLGYENFVENWDKLYDSTDDEAYYEITQLKEMLK